MRLSLPAGVALLALVFVGGCASENERPSAQLQNMSHSFENNPNLERDRKKVQAMQAAENEYFGR
ncbi:MAG: hypothetical protein AB7O26_09880 [Planctomycetaceae bacterium]